MSDETAATSAQLVGVWRLVSSEFRTSGDEVIYPLGDQEFTGVLTWERA